MKKLLDTSFYLIHPSETWNVVLMVSLTQGFWHVWTICLFFRLLKLLMIEHSTHCGSVPILWGMTVPSQPFLWLVKHTQGPGPSWMVSFRAQIISAPQSGHRAARAGPILTCVCYRATHRHCLAAMQGIDGSLGLCMWRIFHKCTPWKRKKKSIRKFAQIQWNSI